MRRQASGMRILPFLTRKSKWKLQVNFQKRGYLPTNVLSDGTPSLYTYRAPQQVIFSLDIEL